MENWSERNRLIYLVYFNTLFSLKKIIEVDEVIITEITKKSLNKLIIFFSCWILMEISNFFRLFVRLIYFLKEFLNLEDFWQIF